MADRKRIVIELDVEGCNDGEIAEVVDAIDNLLDNGGVQALVEEAAADISIDARVMASRVYEGRIEDGA